MASAVMDNAAQPSDGVQCLLPTALLELVVMAIVVMDSVTMGYAALIMDGVEVEMPGAQVTSPAVLLVPRAFFHRKEVFLVACVHRERFQGGGASSCSTCRRGTFEGQMRTACISCGKGYYQDSDGQYSCKICGAGYFQDVVGQSSCKLCPAGSKSLAGSASCEICSAGTYSWAGSSGCYNCVPGTTSQSGASSCAACAKGSYSYSGWAQCISCSKGYYQDSAGQGSCKMCPAGSFQDAVGQGSCKPCSAGSFSLAGSASCSECPTGKYSKSAASTCSDCPIGTYSLESGNEMCEACPLGTYKSSIGSGVCNECSPGTFSDSLGASVCTPCLSGFFSNSTGSSKCSECPPGQYAIEGSNYCSECPKGTFNPDKGKGMCTKCTAGKFSNITGQIACTECATGSFSLEGSKECEQCAAGTFSTQGSAKCLPCLEGTFQASMGKGACVDCPAAHFSDKTGSSECSKCSEGTYNQAAGKTFCLSCPAGEFSKEQSITCSICPQGTFSDEGESTCHPSCGQGKFSPNNLKCSKCPSGQYNDKDHATKCELCGPGTFSAQGSSQCMACVKGTYNPDTGKGACLKCPVGTFSNSTGNVSCEKCPSGLVSQEGAFECEPCKPGTYYSADLERCVLCEEGTYNPHHGKETCFKCPAGSFSKGVGNLKCDMCQPGKFSKDGSSSCVSCGKGTYSSSDRVSCLSCPAGQYSSTEGSTKCEICGPGSFSTAGSPGCSKCLEGTYNSNSSKEDCAKCPFGTFSNSTGSTTCISCLLGQFSLEGAFACSVCPTGYKVKADKSGCSEDYKNADANKIFAIDATKTYEGFVFLDVQRDSLLVNVVGGLCDRHLGTAEIIVSLPSCSQWKGEKLVQGGVKQEHYVVAHDLKVDVGIVGMNKVKMESQSIDLTSVDKSNKKEQGTDPQDDSVLNNTGSSFSQAQNDRLENEEVGRAYNEGLDDIGEQKMLRFQYDGNIVISVTTNSNKAPQSCINNTDGSSFHVLDAYQPFIATFKVEQDFGNSKIARCAHLPDDTKLFIHNEVGLKNNANDNNFITQMELSADVVAQYKKCSSQDKENAVCEYPSCCNLNLTHDELTDGTKSNAHVIEKFRAGPPNIASPFMKAMIIQVGTSTHTMNVLLQGDYDDGIPTRYPLPAMDPIMILRDPPGSGSYAFYENVKTTTKINIAGVEGYMGFKLGSTLGAGVDAEADLCAGLGVMVCAETLSLSLNVALEANMESKFSVAHEVETYQTSFITTWSYQTSAESEPAGHMSDIFVVPSISLLLYTVTEVSLDTKSCKGVAQQKVKFNAEPTEKDNALAFLSMGGVEEMVKNIDETEMTLSRMISDTEETVMMKEAAASALPLLKQASKRWGEIISAYEVVNEFSREANLLKPSTLFSKSGPQGHWSSLIPAELAPKVEAAVGLADWENVQLVSFSGGGAEFQYKADKSVYKEREYMVGGAGENSEQTYEIGALIETAVSALGVNINAAMAYGLTGGMISTSFEHEIASDDSSMGFVFSDADVGDHFDVKIAVDPTYGSFVFKTVGGLSKCWHEEGTKQRESPDISIKSKPVGEILPTNPAIFIVQLANLGETSNDYYLSVVNQDNIGGLGVFANGASLSSNQLYKEMDSRQSKQSTISIHRGPVLYEYPPIQLRFQSGCDDNAYAAIELYTHTRASDSAKVIRFSRECPKVVLDGWLGTGLVVINKDHDGIVPIFVQNVERDFRGSLTKMAEDVDDTLETVEVVYRKRGESTWERKARVKRSTNKNGAEVQEIVDLNLVLSFEDPYGFVSDEWKVTEQLGDGEYEVMVQSKCPKAPMAFREEMSQIAVLRIDRLPPKPFSFPSETATYHVGAALQFEFTEEVDCVIPFSFSVEAKVEGNDRKFNMDNLLMVCQDNKIGVQFDNSKVNLNDIDGKIVQFILKDVRDLCGNIIVEDVKSTIHFSAKEVDTSTGMESAASMKGVRRVQQSVESGIADHRIDADVLITIEKHLAKQSDEIIEFKRHFVLWIMLMIFFGLLVVKRTTEWVTMQDQLKYSSFHQCNQGKTRAESCM